MVCNIGIFVFKNFVVLLTECILRFMSKYESFPKVIKSGLHLVHIIKIKDELNPTVDSVVTNFFCGRFHKNSQIKPKIPATFEQSV